MWCKKCKSCFCTCGKIEVLSPFKIEEYPIQPIIQPLPVFGGLATFHDGRVMGSHVAPDGTHGTCKY